MQATFKSSLWCLSWYVCGHTLMIYFDEFWHDVWLELHTTMPGCLLVWSTTESMCIHRKSCCILILLVVATKATEYKVRIYMHNVCSRPYYLHVTQWLRVHWHWKWILILEVFILCEYKWFQQWFFAKHVILMVPTKYWTYNQHNVLLDR